MFSNKSAYLNTSSHLSFRFGILTWKVWSSPCFLSTKQPDFPPLSTLATVPLKMGTLYWEMSRKELHSGTSVLAFALSTVHLTLPIIISSEIFQHPVKCCLRRALEWYTIDLTRFALKFMFMIHYYTCSAKFFSLYMVKKNTPPIFILPCCYAKITRKHQLSLCHYATRQKLQDNVKLLKELAFMSSKVHSTEIKTVSDKNACNPHAFLPLPVCKTESFLRSKTFWWCQNEAREKPEGTTR